MLAESNYQPLVQWNKEVAEREFLLAQQLGLGTPTAAARCSIPARGTEIPQATRLHQSGGESGRKKNVTRFQGRSPT